MPLPQQIPVRYAEDDAGYVSMRPVVKQTFRLGELADMVVSVVGKDPARVRQIFHTGTVLYNGYRYWWDGLTADLLEFEGLLVPFPDDDPSRPFEPSQTTAVLFEIGGGTQRSIVEIATKEASEKKLFASTSPWDVLLNFAASAAPRYDKYSHSRRADLFRLTLPFDRAQQLLAAMLEAAPRSLRHRWSTLHPPVALTFVAPRK
ncbi:MAG: hypothetical protein WBL63_17040 [Candidatus Acidiferrum sp.]